jgi:hypothetical protein
MNLSSVETIDSPTDFGLEGVSSGFLSLESGRSRVRLNLPYENAILAGCLLMLMCGDEQPRRVAAVCESRGSVYASLEHKNGDVRAVGSPAGCCDGAKLTVVEDEFSELDHSEH